MNTETLAEEATSLLRRLIESLIDRPRDLQIDYRTMDGRVEWRIIPNVDDQGKVVGKGGAHIKAIKFLMAEIGIQHFSKFVVMLEQGPGVAGPDPVRRPAAPTYSVTPAKTLLEDILAALFDEAPAVEVVRDGLHFEFLITAARVQDHDKLQPPIAGDEDAQSLITALATLFNASAKRDGVLFKIEVEA